MSKIMIFKDSLFGETENWRPGVYFDAEYVPAQFCRVKTPWISIWGKKARKTYKKKQFLESWGLPSFQDFLCWGSFFRIKFRRRPFKQKSLEFIKNIQGPIWRSKDHLAMKGLSKNVKNHDFKRFHYSVRQKIGDPGSISTRNMFPLSSVVPKPLESPDGAK